MTKMLKWNDGAPDQIQAGMGLIYGDEDAFFIVGDINSYGSPVDDDLFRIDENHIKAWVWLVNPHESDWHESMARRRK